MKILIIESSYPIDFFNECLDGHVVHHLTKLLRIESRLLYAFDEKHLSKAISIAAEDGYDVVHISCHGADEGITLTNKHNIDWGDFVKIFQDAKCSPDALIMSSCCGASHNLADEFAKSKSRPKIIFGSIDERPYNEYAVAWTLLYDLFNSQGINRDVAQTALKHINAVVHRNFRYLRWHDGDKKYLKFPWRGQKFRISEIVNKN